MNNNFLKFIEKARLVHGYKYEYISYKNMRTPIKLSFNGIIYSQSPHKHLLGRCPEKAYKKLTNNDFISTCNLVWNNRFDYSNTIYNGSLSIIFFTDKLTGIEYSQRAHSHINKIEPFKKMDLNYFINLSIKKHGDKYDYSLVNYINYNEKVKIIYKKTGDIFEQSPSNHLLGFCPEKGRKRSTDYFIHKSKLVHNYKYEYNKTNYINSNISVIITCPIHGDFLKTPVSHLYGSGCPLCSKPIGDKKIIKLLNRKKILYERNKFFDDFELPFDYYIPSRRMCIELIDSENVEYFSKMENDNNLKIEYCEDNYINLITIKCNDDISQIMNKTFNI